MNLEAALKATTESVRGKIPEKTFAAMEAATAQLAASRLAEQALKRGSRMPEFSLPDATGQIVSSVDLLAQGPLLISFYRGHWCPYCNLELKALQERLDDISAKGVTLVAVSPETPDQALTLQQQHTLNFPVLSDSGNRLARKFGLVFSLAETLKPIYQAFGIDLKTFNGDVSFELPVPATYLIDRDGTVLEFYFNVDYRERLAPETALLWMDRFSV